MGVSPTRVGRGPRAERVKSFIGQRMGMVQKNVSRLGWPRPRILPSASILKLRTATTLAATGTTMGGYHEAFELELHPSLPHQAAGITVVREAATVGKEAARISR